MNKIYYRLNSGMYSRLEELAEKCNVDPMRVIKEYGRRKRVIEEAYRKEYQFRESRILVKAYRGTEKHYREINGGI